MIHLSKRAQDGTASLMIGSDLRAAESNAEWRRLQLPDGKSGERIDKLFPGTDVGGYVLDVLASGVSSENVVIRMRADSETRYLCASFYPLPSAAKPRKVRMTVVEMKACLVLDAETGAVLEANQAAKAIFGDTPSLPYASLRTPIAAAARNGSHYLGKFQHRRPDGSDVELESIFVAVEDAEQTK